MNMRTLLFFALLAIGCESADIMVVTVEKRPAVVDARSLHVTVSNAGEMQEQDFDLAGQTFPATFGIKLGERTGELAIAIDALDEAGVSLGRGEAVAPIEDDARVMLEAQDFIVNTDRSRPHDLGFVRDDTGFQLAAASDDTWSVVFTAPGNAFARRFDLTGQPVDSAAAPGGGKDSFQLSMDATSEFTAAAVATSSISDVPFTIGVWGDENPADAASVQCRAIAATGALGELQARVSLDDAPRSVSAAGLPNGNFVVVWSGFDAARRIRRAIVRPNCQPIGVVAVVSEELPPTFPVQRSHVAANATRVLHVWKLGNAIRVRAADHLGAFVTPDKELFAVSDANELLQFARVAPLPDGFAVLVRRTNANGGPGRIELLRTTSDGTLVGTPILVTDRSDSDSDSIESFGVASRPDGHILVVWAACLSGDGDGCGVFGQLMSPTGQQVNTRFSLATTTAKNQLSPSAAALSDGSFAATWVESADTFPSEGDVRARIVYPAP